MSKHTPGPWVKSQYGELKNPEGKDIYVWGLGVAHGNRMQESEANARLISAAPELLEALENIITTYSKPDDRICCNGIDCGCMGATKYQQAEHYAKEAIARAKGEAS